MKKKNNQQPKEYNVATQVFWVYELLLVRMSISSAPLKPLSVAAQYSVELNP